MMAWLRVLGGALLVSGTTIGAAMLALPVTVGIAGFLPALLLFVLCWGFMMFSAFLLLEVNHTIGGSANLITMARKTLGRVGEGFAWIFYLLLLYCLNSAYLSGCGAVLVDQISRITGVSLSEMWGPLPFALLFGWIVFLGIRPVDYVNRVLMLVLVVLFACLVGVVLPHVQATLLANTRPSYALLALPVAITAFGYHIIIPSLATYLRHNVRHIRIAILLGSTLPLLVYLLIVLAIIGVVPPSGDGGLFEALQSGQPAVALAYSLEQILGLPWIYELSTYCSLFAILTSILGISLSLSDCLADGLSIQKDFKGRWLLSTLTFLPPLIFAWYFPRGFIVALSYGGIFVAVLLGIMPAMMAWSERYRRKSPSDYRTVGGKSALVVSLLFFLAVICVELFQQPLEAWLS